MGQKAYTFIISTFLIGIGILILLGVVRDREMGICFGSCNEAREREFSWRFDDWIISQIECGDGKVAKTLLAAIAPELSRRLRETNGEFELLAQLEQDGALTVREREDYLSHSWRVPDPRILLNQIYGHLPPPTTTIPKEPDDRLIRSCGKARFNLRNGEPNSYCEGYVHFDFDSHPQSSRSWSVMKNEFYATLVANGEIEWLIDTMRGALRKDKEFRQTAEEEVLDLPASSVSSAEIERLSQLAYIRKKCDPA